MNINIYATPMSQAAFMVANVCDNVRLQKLQDCCMVWCMVYRRGVIAVEGVYCIGQLMIK